MNSKSFFVIILFFISLPLVGQYSIEGQIEDEEHRWEIVYLEYIQSINDLKSFRMNNVLNSSKIDSTGNFEIKGDELPKGKRLYRLTLSEEDNGNYGGFFGLRKNSIYLILDKNMYVNLECSLSNISFANCNFQTSPENKVITYLNDELLFGYFRKRAEDYESITNSETKKQFLSKKKTDELKHFADTCQFLIPSLFAIRSLEDLRSEIKYDPQYFDSFVKKIVKIDATSPYVIEMKNEILSQQEILFGVKKKINWLAIGLGILCLTLIGYIFTLYKKVNDLQNEKQSLTNSSVKDDAFKLDKLSPQEIKVLELITLGKTNKEIAQNLFIEPTTVKSHVNKIYHKLNISSRKEASKWGKML